MRLAVGVGVVLWAAAVAAELKAVAATVSEHEHSPLQRVASQWALETFVDLAAADGDVLKAELRRHCCHGIAETTQSFCEEFKIPPRDCDRLQEFMQHAPNKSSSCECSDTERGLRSGRHDARMKLSTATVRVLRTYENRKKLIKVAVHKGDLSELDARVDNLCERLELDSVACGSLRTMLRERSVVDEIHYHKQTLLEHTTNPSVVDDTTAAMEAMMQALLAVNSQLQEELAQKAEAFASLYRQAKNDRHDLERRIRTLENDLQQQLSCTATSLDDRPRGRQIARAPLSAARITERPPFVVDSGPTFATGSLRIPRVHVSNFSYVQYHEFARSSTPVIIQGLGGLPGSPGLPKWTLQSLHTACGDAVVTLKKPRTSRPERASTMMWAGIEPVAQAPLRHFLRDFTSRGAAMTWPYGYADLYLHDASIRAFCPRLLDEFTFPRYFTDDRLQLLSSSKQSSYWPSLFIGGASTASALHADWASTAAWMGLLAGKKHWAIAQPSARAALLELVPTEQARSPGRFNASLLSGELSALLRPGEVYEDVLEAGEVLFIPADCPHQVQNLDKTIAVAVNFVDSANVDAFRQHVATARDSTSGDEARGHAQSLRRLAAHTATLQAADRLSDRFDLSYAQFKEQYHRPEQESEPQ